MAINDNATFMPATGRFYIADVGTAFPSDPKKPGSGWTELGHTSAETPIEFTTEGGEKTTIATLQAAAHRTRVSPRVDGAKLKLHQFDIDTLKLYFGANSKVVSGRLQVAQNPQATEKAFLAVFVDGERVFATLAPRSEIQQDGNLALSDPEKLAEVPLSVTFLIHGTNDYALEIMPVAGGAAGGVGAGGQAGAGG